MHSRGGSFQGYLDFEVEIRAGDGLHYPVVVLNSPEGQAQASMRFPFNASELETQLVNIENVLLRVVGSRRQAPTQDQESMRLFGEKLFNALIAGNVREGYRASLRQAVRSGQGLRLKLRVQPPELASLPWEYLYDPNQAEYLCLSTRTPLVRYLPVPQPVQPLQVDLPLRVLVMASNPQAPGFDNIHIEREKERLGKAIQPLQSNGLLDLTWLEGSTWRHLNTAMRRENFHIFHFIGHGGFDEKADEGEVVLEDEDGRADYICASDLARLLTSRIPPRLVLLNACQGASGSQKDVFSSTASILVRRGIPAVLAMQYAITDQAAIEFTRNFYEALADGLPVDAATAEARIALSLARRNSFEWGTPVLYLRAPDGVLFDLAGARPKPSATVEMVEADTIEESGSTDDLEERQRLAQEALRVAGEVKTLTNACQAALAAQDWEKAQSAIHQIEALDPENPQVTQLQTSLTETRQAAEKRQQEEAAKQRVTASLTAYETAFTTAVQVEDWGKAQAALDALEELGTQGQSVSDRLRQQLQAKKQDAEARRVAVEVQELVNNCQAALEAQNLEAAEAVIQQIVALDPENPQVTQLQTSLTNARLAVEQRQQDEAIKRQVTVQEAAFATTLQADDWEKAQSALDRLAGLGTQGQSVSDRLRQQLDAKKQQAETRQIQAQQTAFEQALERSDWRKVSAALRLMEGLGSAGADRAKQLRPKLEQARQAEQIQRRQRLAKILGNRKVLSYLLGGILLAALVVTVGIFTNNWMQESGFRTQTQAAMETSIERKASQTAQFASKATATARAAFLLIPSATPGPATPPPCTQAGQTWTSPVDGMELVCVPAGPFLMGSKGGEEDEKPVHEVTLDAFWIDRTEVTNDQYANCVEAGICSQPGELSSYSRENYYNDPDYANYPVIYVNWNQADTYCEWSGRQLPTEAEWEKAARGTDGRTYPWGEAISCTKANFSGCVGNTTAVSNYPNGASPYKALDMAGNVWEWVADWYDEVYYQKSPERNPGGPASGEFRVLRGGSWYNGGGDLHSSNRVSLSPDNQSNLYSFRCARSAQLETSESNTLTPEIDPTSTTKPDPNNPPPCTQAGQTWTSPVDGMTMVCVPAGTFSMGSEDGDDDEKPVHEVTLDAFWIDRTEVTNAMFTAFVQATGYQTEAEDQGWGYVWTDSGWEQVEGADWQHPPGPGSSLDELSDHPVVQVSWNDAKIYCRWAKRRLPTEAEWEKAARGADGRTYPWGESIDCTLANYSECERDTKAVGSYPQGASPYGALDMAGNVWEWVADWYGENYYQDSLDRNPQGPTSGEYRVLRGGSGYFNGRFLRSSNRSRGIPDTRFDLYGFRCARSE